MGSCCVTPDEERNGGYGRGPDEAVPRRHGKGKRSESESAPLLFQQSSSSPPMPSSASSRLSPSALGSVEDAGVPPGSRDGHPSLLADVPVISERDSQDQFSRHQRKRYPLLADAGAPPAAAALPHDDAGAAPLSANVESIMLPIPGDRMVFADPETVKGDASFAISSHPQKLPGILVAPPPTLPAKPVRLAVVDANLLASAAAGLRKSRPEEVGVPAHGEVPELHKVKLRPTRPRDEVEGKGGKSQDDWNYGVALGIAAKSEFPALEINRVASVVGFDDSESPIVVVKEGHFTSEQLRDLPFYLVRELDKYATSEPFVLLWVLNHAKPKFSDIAPQPGIPFFKRCCEVLLHPKILHNAKLVCLVHPFPPPPPEPRSHRRAASKAFIPQPRPKVPEELSLADEHRLKVRVVLDVYHDEILGSLVRNIRRRLPLPPGVILQNIKIAKMEEQARQGKSHQRKMSRRQMSRAKLVHPRNTIDDVFGQFENQGVFKGLSIPDQMLRERLVDPTDVMVPRFLDLCCQRIEHDAATEGLFRRNGAKPKVDRVIALLNAGFAVDVFHCRDVTTVTSLVKQWFRELPECVFTTALVDDFLRIGESREKQSVLVERLEKVLQRVPRDCYNVACRFFWCLKAISDRSDENLMTVSNLAICVSPNLFRKDDQAMLMSGVGGKVVGLMIKNADRLYPAYRPKPHQEGREGEGE